MRPMHGVENTIGKTIARMESGGGSDEFATISMHIYFTDGTGFSFNVATKSWMQMDDGERKPCINVNWAELSQESLVKIAERKNTAT